jgi:hypothetical protein
MPLVEPLMKTGRQQSLRRDNIDPADLWQTSEKVEVGWPEAIIIGCSIGHGHDDMGIGSRRSGFEQHRSQAVFVHASSGRHATFEFSERGRQKLGLPQ